MDRDREEHAPDGVTLPVAREELVIRRREVAGDTVRVDVVTHARDVLVDEPVHHERVVVERVPIGRLVRSVPEVRREGDTTIIPIVEEEIVVQRRLRVTEEVRIRHVVEVRHHRETVRLREQEAVVTRTPPAPGEPTA